MSSHHDWQPRYRPSARVESALVATWPRPGKRTTQTPSLRTVTVHSDYDHGGQTGSGTYWRAAALHFRVGWSCASILTQERTGLAFLAIGLTLFRYFGVSRWSLFDGALVLLSAVLVFYGTKGYRRAQLADRRIGKLLVNDPGLARAT